MSGRGAEMSTFVAKALTWAIWLLLALAVLSLAVVAVVPWHGDDEARLMFFVLLALLSALMAGGFAVALARHQRFAWVLVLASLLIAGIAYRSCGLIM